MIGDADVLPRQHDIPGNLRPGPDQAVLAVRPPALLAEPEAVPAILAQGLARRVQRQPPSERLTRRQPPLFLCLGQGSPAEHLALRPLSRPVRGAGDLVQPLAAGAETAVDEPPGAQAVQRRPVVVKMLGLPAHRLLPIQAEPAQVLQDGPSWRTWAGSA